MKCPLEALFPLQTGDTQATHLSQLARATRLPTATAAHHRITSKKLSSLLLFTILHSRSSSSYRQLSSNMKDTSFEESDEQDYGYGGYNKGDGAGGKISLGALKYID